jgi:hypothetical protein
MECKNCKQMQERISRFHFVSILFLLLFILVMSTSCASGPNGMIVDGKSGHSSLVSLTRVENCVVMLSWLDMNDNGLYDTKDSNMYTQAVCDGVNGVDGQDGVDAPLSQFDIVDIIDVCGDSPSVIDEVIVKLRNGQLLVSFSANAAGANTRFSLLPAGSYVTTDGSACYFQVKLNGEVVNAHY